MSGSHVTPASVFLARQRKIGISFKTFVASLVLAFAGGIGCHNQCFMTEADFSYARATGIPPNLECDSHLSIVPPGGAVPTPTTIDDTQREPRYLSLREAIAIALENGTVGGQNASSPGFANDGLGGFSGRAVQSADAIKVLALEPAIIATNIEIALSKFDVQWNNALTWNRTESPLGTSPTLSTSIGGGAAINSVATDKVDFRSGLVKPLPTGGAAGITFSTAYQHSDPAAKINPSYEPNLQFVFEQPLLQGYGIEINQLRESHPGSLLLPFPGGGQVEGILITRIRLDQQRAEFERSLSFLLLNVEGAYWNLYGAYYQLYSREEGMRYAFESWRLTKLGLEAGRAAEQDLEQARLQYEQFRSQRLTALGQVLESERQLRGLLGLKIEDGTRIIPADSPTQAPVKPDWHSSLDEALAQRPELILARQDLKFRQLDLIKEKNLLLPDLRFIASDDIHSIGTQIDGGSTPANAFHELFANPFNNFSLGLRMNVPLGFRAAHAGVRAARLNLQRSYLSLRTEEDKAERFLGLAYRQVLEFQQQIQVQQAALRAATIQLESIYALLRLGGRGKPFGADLILAQRDWSNTVANYYSAIVQYNTALATLEFAKGAIMRHDSVYVADGPLPCVAQVRAVEHERQRTKALVLRERALPGYNSRCAGGPNDNQPAVHAPVDTPLPLPVLQHAQPPIPEMPGNVQPFVQQDRPACLELPAVRQAGAEQSQWPVPETQAARPFARPPISPMPGNGQSVILFAAPSDPSEARP